jgi:hypothetical protein
MRALRRAVHYSGMTAIGCQIGGRYWGTCLSEVPRYHSIMTFSYHSENPGPADNVSIYFLAEILEHIQAGLTDGRDDTSAEKQGNGRICAHSTKKRDFHVGCGREGWWAREKRKRVRTCSWISAPSDVQPPSCVSTQLIPEALNLLTPHKRIEQGESLVTEFRIRLY